MTTGHRRATGSAEVVFTSGDQTVTVPLVLSGDIEDPGAGGGSGTRA